MLIVALAMVFFENALVCYSFTLAHHHVVLCNVVLLTEFAPSLDFSSTLARNSKARNFFCADAKFDSSRT